MPTIDLMTLTNKTSLVGSEQILINDSNVLKDVTVDILSDKIEADTKVTLALTTGAGLVGYTPTAPNVATTTQAAIDYAISRINANSFLSTDYYQTGSWTPVGNGITLTTAIGTYTKIGDVMHCFFNIVFPTTSNASLAIISGLPVSAGTSGLSGASLGRTINPNGYYMYAWDSTIKISDKADTVTTNAQNSGNKFAGSIVYKIA
jgi:hypothetical protein